MDSWPKSKRAVIGMLGIPQNQQSTASDSEIQAIADMMDESAGKATQQTINPNVNVTFDVTPDKAAEIMIQNYIKRNGSIIIG